MMKGGKGLNMFKGAAMGRDEGGAPGGPVPI